MIGHLLSILFFLGLLVALAVILEHVIVRPSWPAIVAALRGGFRR